MSTLLGATIFRADGEVTNDLTALLAAVAAEARAEALEEAASLAARELGPPPLYAGIKDV